ncbi:MAG: hypothetical protein M0030_20715 [Actinomycetota bacterium]|nr:hypothetical protein [Actinomycetota bacterium]
MPRTRSIQTRERDLRALELRRLNMTYAQIAREMGWRSQAAAHQAVQRALADSVAEPAAEVRQMELDRLDEIARVYRRVLARDHLVVADGRVVKLDGQPLLDSGPLMQAAAGLLRVSESRRKLLGLDAPAKSRVQVITEDAIDEAIAQLTQELGGNDSVPDHPGAR